VVAGVHGRARRRLPDWTDEHAVAYNVAARVEPRAAEISRHTGQDAGLCRGVPCGGGVAYWSTEVACRDTGMRATQMTQLRIECGLDGQDPFQYQLGFVL